MTDSRIPGLDEWRGVACLLVLFFHVGVNLKFAGVPIYGFLGVFLFFVLSGYLISRPYFSALLEGREPKPLRIFYQRRWMRLYPAYFAVLVACTLVRWGAHARLPTAGNFVAHALLIFNYGDRADFFSINAVFWSLAIEIQFYLLLPLIFAASSRLFRAQWSGAWIVAVFLLVGPLARALEVGYLGVPDAGASHLVQFRSLFSFLDLFGVGMLTAYLQESRATLRASKAPKVAMTAMAALGLVIIVAAMSWCANVTGGAWMTSPSLRFSIVFPLTLAIGIFLPFTALIGFVSQEGRRFRIPLLAWIGTISYSLYLTHIFVQLAVMHAAPSPGFGWGWLTLGPCLLVAWIVYQAVEKPALRRAQKT